MSVNYRFIAACIFRFNLFTLIYGLFFLLVPLARSPNAYTIRRKSLIDWLLDWLLVLTLPALFEWLIDWLIDWRIELISIREFSVVSQQDFSFSWFMASRDPFHQGVPFFSRTYRWSDMGTHHGIWDFHVVPNCLSNCPGRTQAIRTWISELWAILIVQSSVFVIRAGRAFFSCWQARWMKTSLVRSDYTGEWSRFA